jgi:hypothetical protein
LLTGVGRGLLHLDFFLPKIYIASCAALEKML